MGCDNNEDNFVLTIMLALGVCLCVIAFFCGGEMMMKVPAWTRCVICIAAGLISLGVCVIVLCFCVSSVCKVFNCCKAIKISEKEYFVLTKENINDRSDFKYRKKILVHKDVDKIPPFTFSCNYYLEKIEFIGEISVYESAFLSCPNLREVVFYNDIISIGENAFAGCKELKEIILPSGITEIKDNTFNNCKTLEKIDLPDTVQSIGKNAFKGCKSLATITIPKSVTSIGDDAFAGCTKLLTINYTGTKEDWNTKIKFGSNWEKDVPAKVVACSDGIENLDSDNNSDDSKPSDTIAQ